jgi:hexokinase
LSRSYTSGGSILGAIFGTGTNGAYVESLSRIPKLAKTHPELYSSRTKGEKMVVNTEWGAFNNTRTYLPTTPFDSKLDRESINPSFQAFEKFVSGMYLGEVVRNILLYLIDANHIGESALLFRGKSTKLLNTQWGFDTRVMSEVEDAYGSHDAPDASLSLGSEKQFDEDTQARLKKVKEVIVKETGLADGDVSLRDAAVVRRVCRMVGRRAAKMSSVAVAATLVQTRCAKLAGSPSLAASSGEAAEPLVPVGEKIGIGFDGSLVEHYPGFMDTMRESLSGLVGEEVESKVDFGMAKDGSGVGGMDVMLSPAL